MTRLITDSSIDFIERHKDKPFFLFVSHECPHFPFQGPGDAKKLIDKTNWTKLDAKAYVAMLEDLDREVGRVLAALERHQLADNTLVIFAGDNGLALGGHGLMGKQNLYDHSVRVPLVLSGPGIPQGRTSNALVYLSDIYATLFELIGEPLPDSVEGASLVPAMGSAESGPRDTLFTAYRGYQRAVRDRRHKLIEYSVDGERRTQLFDLETDPWEMQDLSADAASAQTLTRLRAELSRWQTDLDDPSPIAV